MKNLLVIVFISLFLLTNAGSDSNNAHDDTANNNHQCPSEHAKIMELEMQINLLKQNNQALAAAGGMSAVNMLVSFLSGYAGSHSNQNHGNSNCCDDERYYALAERVKVLEEHMAHVQQGDNFEDRCNSDGNLFFDGHCFFFSGASPTVDERYTECESKDASLAEIRSAELQNAVLEFAQTKLNVSDDVVYRTFWIGGEFSFSSSLITYPDGTQQDADELTWAGRNPIETGPLSMAVFKSQSGLVNISPELYAKEDALDPLVIPIASLCQVHQP